MYKHKYENYTVKLNAVLKNTYTHPRLVHKHARLHAQ